MSKEIEKDFEEIKKSISILVEKLIEGQEETRNSIYCQIVRELLNEAETEMEEDTYCYLGWSNDERQKKYGHVVIDFRIPRWYAKKFHGGVSDISLIEKTLRNILISMIRMSDDAYSRGELDEMKSNNSK